MEAKKETPQTTQKPDVKVKDLAPQKDATGGKRGGQAKKQGKTFNAN